VAHSLSVLRRIIPSLLVLASTHVGARALSSTQSAVPLPASVASPANRTSATTASANPSSSSSALATGCTPTWISTFGSLPGTDDDVLAMQVFDSGSGPDLYVGGWFNLAGSTSAHHIARWDGARWHALGAGMNGPVFAMTTYDDGTGPALYVGGAFTTADGVPTGGLARWNGTSWSAVGGILNGNAYSFAVFDDGHGGGPALFVGGWFNGVGTSAAQTLAKWNGATWSGLPVDPSGTIRTLAVYAGGPSGTPALYAGGNFNAYPGVTNFGRFNGTTWTSLTPTLVGGVNALLVYDDGSGPKLYLGGTLYQIGSLFSLRGIATWNGTSFATVGGGVGSDVTALIRYDDGTGAKLYAAGSFTEAQGAAGNRVARWDGATWTALAGGVTGTGLGAYAMAVYDDGFNGPNLCVGGEFTSANGLTVANVARWNGAQWGAIGNGLSAEVHALHAFDDGSGRKLYAGGQFISAGGAPSRRVAAWDGTHWSPLGSGFNADVNALVSFDDGSGHGLQLYAGGEFSVTGPNTPVARWTGTTWVMASTGPQGFVNSMIVFDDGSGPTLYAGGHFNDSGPVLKLTGTGWTPIATAYPYTQVRVLEIFDDGLGGGPKLYAGGDMAGGLVKWSGSSWSTVAGGISGGSLPEVYALEVYDDGLGGGPDLFVGGGFLQAGAIPAVGIARWNGSTWSALGSGMEAPIAGGQGSATALRTFLDAGTGTTKLAVGGWFAKAGGVPANFIASFDGATWSALGNGTNAQVLALEEFDSGAGPRLHVGGLFTSIPDSGDSYIGVWGCANVSSVATFCSGDGTGTACPCGNVGAAGRGCANSVDVLGARLTASGTASLAADSLHLIGSSMPNSSALYYQGTTQQSGGAGAVFGDGLRCVGGAIVRLGTVVNAGGGSMFPAPGGTAISVRGAIAAPGLRHYQAWYRNAASFCTPSTFNLTNGVSVTWGS
jgi:trimeric autotransporter adhesin